MAGGRLSYRSVSKMLCIGTHHLNHILYIQIHVSNYKKKLTGWDREDKSTHTHIECVWKCVCVGDSMFNESGYYVKYGTNLISVSYSICFGYVAAGKPAYNDGMRWWTFQLENPKDTHVTAHMHGQNFPHVPTMIMGLGNRSVYHMNTTQYS